MADPQNQRDHNFELSYAHSDDRASYATAGEAGKAFADANVKLAPRVIESSDEGARTLANIGRVGDEYFKQVPTPEAVQADKPRETEVQFWTGYHDRMAEKARSAGAIALDDTPFVLREPVVPQPVQGSKDKGQELPKDAQPVSTPALDSLPEGSAELAKPQPEKSQDERFALPMSFQERFILTREGNRQEMFRSYDDKRPAILDRGDSLHTKNADRSTAMDMIELAAHRGWSSMKVKGPEEFRREMWIEGTAQGIEVKGYRPNDKDRAEAERRAEMIGERVIERTDNGKFAPGSQAGPATVAEPQEKGSNVIQMIDYQKGLEGKITAFGTAPYRDREGASSTPYVALELADGRTHKLWGVGLPDMLEKNQLRVGDKATIYDDGKKAVTITERDPKTGEERQKNTFRREWGARDVERSQEQARIGVKPVQKDDDPVIENVGSYDPKKEAATVATDPKAEMGTKHHSDNLEQRLLEKEAARDPQLRGATSVLARIEAEMRMAGVSDKDRATVLAMATQELAGGIRSGRKYDVQRLPNVTAKQQAAARALTSKDVSRIIEQARVKGPVGPRASGKSDDHRQERSKERSQPQAHRER
ncbi:LPD7 domain-containing protein [Phaeobacter sp. A90a-4k]|uniref:LPD7 domain-containing protein n=1 Tax=unclassified Phaeobacter TaxID=2621772 RepID=UPI003A88315B